MASVHAKLTPLQEESCHDDHKSTVVDELNMAFSDQLDTHIVDSYLAN